MELVGKGGGLDWEILCWHSLGMQLLVTVVNDTLDGWTGEECEDVL